MRCWPPAPRGGAVRMDEGFAMAERNPLIIMAAGKGSRMRHPPMFPGARGSRLASEGHDRIGQDRKPLLQRLVERAKEEGLYICIVIGEHTR